MKRVANEEEYDVRNGANDEKTTLTSEASHRVYVVFSKCELLCQLVASPLAGVFVALSRFPPRIPSPVFGELLPLEALHEELLGRLEAVPIHVAEVPLHRGLDGEVGGVGLLLVRGLHGGHGLGAAGDFSQDEAAWVRAVEGERRGELVKVDVEQWARLPQPLSIPGPEP